MTEFNTKEKYLRLSELGNRIKQAIDNTLGGFRFWIVAEIASKNIRKGHCYLTLVDKDETSPEIKAEIKGIIWSDNFTGINKRFRDVTGNDISENTSILFSCLVNYNVKFGLSIVINDIEPQYTIGLLMQEREKIIAKLKQTGYYELNKNKAFPLVPQRIAVISAIDSRGYEDFKTKLTGNAYNYKFKLKLYSSLLQGDKAAEDVRDRLIEIYNRINEFDIVVIARGGGGAVNMSCFNNYRLAEAVARYPIPVITGIGHTANVSVVDEVAYCNRSTPTDVADYIVKKVNDYEQRIFGLFNDVIENYRNITRESGHKLELMTKNLLYYSKLRMMGEFASVQNIKNKLNTLNMQLINEEKKNNNNIYNNLRNLSGNIINARTSKLGSQMLKISVHSQKKVELEMSRMQNIEEKIEILDPRNTLKRGFSITRLNGKAVKMIGDVKKGDIINTEVYKGEIESEVVKTQNSAKKVHAKSAKK